MRTNTFLILNEILPIVFVVVIIILYRPTANLHYLCCRQMNCTELESTVIYSSCTVTNEYNNYDAIINLLVNFRYALHALETRRAAHTTGLSPPVLIPAPLLQLDNIVIFHSRDIEKIITDRNRQSQCASPTLGRSRPLSSCAVILRRKRESEGEKRKK